MTINPQFKDKSIKIYKTIKLLYLIAIHALLLWHSPFINYTSENGSQMLLIEVGNYKKTILFTNE